MSIKIVTDSTCDLPGEMVAQLGITVMPMYINVRGRGYLDGVEISRTEFYHDLPTYDPPATTAAVSPQSFRQTYERLAAEGATAILSIHISETLSAVVNAARSGAAETQEVPVTVFDSRQLSMGTGFLVLAAARAVAAGRSMGVILRLLQEQIPRTHVVAALDTLEYLRRSGRLNGAVSAMGTLLQVKPLLRMFDGQATVERVRTRERALARLIDLLVQAGPLEQVAILHSNAMERACDLKDRVQAWLPPHAMLPLDITPVIGAHIGPGVVGVAFVTASGGKVEPDE